MLRLRERIAKEQPLSCSSPVHRPGFILLFISHFPRRRENRHQYFACKDLFKATMATQGTLTGSYSASLASVSLSDLRFVFSPFFSAIVQCFCCVYCFAVVGIRWSLHTLFSSVESCWIPLTFFFFLSFPPAGPSSICPNLSPCHLVILFP